MSAQMIKVKEFYNKYKIFVYPAVISISCVIIIALILLPQIKAFIEGQSTLTDTNQKAKFLEVKAADLSNLDANDLNNKLLLAVSALPTDKDYGSIIGLIQRIGADSGVAVADLALSPTTADKSSGFSVKVGVVGLRQSINSMIQSIEKSPRVMKITGIDISTSNLDGTVAASFVINAFYAPAPQSLGSIDSELPKLSAHDQEILAILASNSVALPVGSSQLLPRGKANPFQ